MRRRRLRALVGAAVLAAALVLGSAPTVAQEPSTSEVRTPTIIPTPNDGTAPEDPGDRGGVLQLLVLGLVVLAIGGAVLHLRSQARQARS